MTTTQEQSTTEFNHLPRAVSDHAYELSKRTHRAGAVLRLLQFGFNNDHRDDKICPYDVRELVDLTLEVLPHHYTDVLDPLDALSNQSARAVFAAQTENENLTAILAAMTVAARGDSTPNDIDAAAGIVFKLARSNPAYESNWRAFCAVVEGRGYRLRVRKTTDHLAEPLVYTPELERLSRKVDRSQAAFISAVHESSEARRRRQPAPSSPAAPMGATPKPEKNRRRG